MFKHRLLEDPIQENGTEGVPLPCLNVDPLRARQQELDSWKVPESDQQR